jgi:hypothetical protein
MIYAMNENRFIRRAPPYQTSSRRITDHASEQWWNDPGSALPVSNIGE